MSIFIILCFLSALVIRHGGTGATTGCKDSDWDRCEQQLDRFVDTDFPSIRSPTELTSICIMLKKSLVCEQKFADRCFSADMKVRFKTAMDQMQNQLSGKCKPGQSTERKLFQKCLHDFKYLKKYGIQTEVTETELTRFCKFTTDAMNCLQKYAEKYMNASEISEMEEDSARMRKFMDAVCVPGDPFRLRYLNYTGCYPKFAAHFEKCQNYSGCNEQLIEEASMAPDEKREQFCCCFRNFRHCARTVIQRTCGETIANTGVEIIELLMGDNIESLCTLSISERPKCLPFYTSSSSLMVATTKIATITAASITIMSMTTAPTTDELPFGNTAVPLGSFPSLFFFVFLFVATLYC